MIARKLISDSVPSVKTSDTAERVLAWMAEFKVSQLPIVNVEGYLGLIREDDLFEVSDQHHPIGDVDLAIPPEIFVYEDSHIYEVLKLMSEFKLDIMPVLDYQKIFLGVVTQRDILNFLAEAMGAKEQGGIIVLEMQQNGYSLSEIGRICESSDARVLSMTMSNGPGPGLILITLKLNIRDMSRVVAAFERFKYQIYTVVFDAEKIEEFRENYEALLRFLNP